MTKISKIYSVWHRNWKVYFKTWKINFLPSFLEPVLYFAGFGLGFTNLIKEINYGGRTYSYMEFIISGLVVVTGMNNAFFENTFGTYVRMYYEKIFEAMMATPLSADDIILGELAWGVTKSVMSSVIVFTIVSLLGVISFRFLPAVLLISILTGLCFSSVAIFITAITPSIDNFNLPVFLFITPMFIFSGVFFPLSELPAGVQLGANFLPLTHLVKLFRSIISSDFNMSMLGSFSYIAAFSAFFTITGVRKMKKRLIK